MTGKRPTRKQVEDAFETAVAKDNRCNLGKLLDSVDSGVREVIETKVADELNYSKGTLTRVLKDLGFRVDGKPVGEDTIGKHRRNNCRCAR